jgi:hypothetical protein
MDGKIQGRADMLFCGVRFWHTYLNTGLLRRIFGLKVKEVLGC